MNSYPFVKTALVASATLVVIACTTTPVRFTGADHARERLSLLEGNSNLVHQAPMALSEARTAVSDAEQAKKDPALSDHLVFIAERKVEIAEAESQRGYLEAQRSELIAERDKMRLEARTHESKVARDAASQAIAENAAAQRLTFQAQSDVATAQKNMKNAQQQAANAETRLTAIQNQLDDMEAQKTSRGEVVTLGDVLFDFNKSEIRRPAISHLAKLAMFLNTNTDRIATIEGHTDNVGTDAFNMVLSQRRAEAVKNYLQSQGVAGERLRTIGKGAHSPVTDNMTAQERLQNRRVEVIITSPVIASSNR